MARNQRTQNSDVVKSSESPKAEKQTENQTDTKGQAENQSAERSSSQSESGEQERRKAVSLKKELHDLERGFSVIEKLLDAAQISLENAEEIALIAELMAILGFVRNRMIMVRRMIEGDLNPSEVWTTFNDADAYWKVPDNTDVIFVEWNVNQKVIYARSQLDLAERMVAEELEREKETVKDDEDELN